MTPSRHFITGSLLRLQLPRFWQMDPLGNKQIVQVRPSHPGHLVRPHRDYLMLIKYSKSLSKRWTYACNSVARGAIEPLSPVFQTSPRLRIGEDPPSLSYPSCQANPFSSLLHAICPQETIATSTSRPQPLGQFLFSGTLGSHWRNRAPVGAFCYRLGGGY